MNVSSYRRAMGAGIAFVILMVVGAETMLGNSPDISSKDSSAAAAREYLRYLSDSGHRAGLIVSAFLLILAGLAFIWFTLGLRDRLGDRSTSGRLVGSFGVFGAVALAASGMCAAGTAGGMSFGGEPLPANGDAIRAVLDLTFPFVFVVFGLASAAVIGVVAAAALRGEGWPKWVGWFGLLGVLGSLFGAVFVPFVVPMVWYLAVSIAGVTAKALVPDQRGSSDADATGSSQQRSVKA